MPRDGPSPPGAGLPDSPGAHHRRDVLGRVLGAEAGDGPHRHYRRDLQAERAHRARQELRDRRGDATGEFCTRYAFDDSDVFKIIEGASYALAIKPDPALDAYVDTLIAKIAKAQEPDGYLYTARTIDPAKPMEMAGKERWTNEQESHELYNVGHLYEAAVAHYQATGKRTLLDVATKNADLIVRTFGPAGLRYPAGHQEIEIGLVKLFRRRRTAGTSRWRSSSSTSAASRPATSSTASTRRITSRSWSRPRRSATPSARPTCTPPWPTSRRSRATRGTWRPSIGSGTTSCSASSI